MKRASSIVRKHRASEKVYVPANARDNHYIIAEMPLTDTLIKLMGEEIKLSSDQPYLKFYQSLAKLVWDVVEECNIEHANFVANNRLVRVRNSDEQQVLHTDKQSFFFYNPMNNSTFKGYFDGAIRSNKVKFLFLATGENLREGAAKFHQKVYKAVREISQRIGLKQGELKVRDHQHLTYDIFAREKGSRESISHTFREISTRYLQQEVVIEGDYSAVTYAVVSVPMTRRLLKGTEIDYEDNKPFSLLYEKIYQAFTESNLKNHINRATMIANGLSPIVRYDENERVIVNGDIISLGYNPSDASGKINCQWEAEKLVDTIRLVFFATDLDQSHKTYGKFVNQVVKSVENMAEILDWKRDKDYMLMRMNQQLVRRI
ncbi:DUF3083 family protein [Colwellia psychrerythraea]|uniref:DUF3083 family protein n=1 Tax=Colwellia psychrerythraea TaxID=28229 RepID=A0A099KQX4_COLPS|nr:DUF3083 family protein [Colwellia psychrerythraea]KGJ92595.1 Protein of unknown function DUF3083 [Colwellia psychrerythraea]